MQLSNPSCLLNSMIFGIKMSYSENSILEFSGFRKGIETQGFFFHLTTIQRKQYNCVICLQTLSGDWIGRLSFSLLLGISFHLYTALPLQDYNQFLNIIPSIVTPKINEALLSHLADDNVRIFVFQLGDHKASNPDGFSSTFL